MGGRSARTIEKKRNLDKDLWEEKNSDIQNAMRYLANLKISFQIQTIFYNR